VVNAVVVVIVVSLFGSSVIAARSAPRIAPAAGSGRSLGSVVVTAIVDPGQATRLVPLAARIARTDGGNLVPVHVIADADNEHTIVDARTTAKGIDEIVRKAGFDADHSLRVAVSIRQGIRNEITERDASLLVLGHTGRARPATYLFGSMSEEVVSGSPVPALVAMLDAAPIRRVVLPVRRRDLGVNGLGETRLAMQVAGFLERSGLKLVVATRDGTNLEDPPVPSDAELLTFAGGRVAWVSAFAGAGDLVLLPGGSAGLVFDTEAHRIAAIEGVSVAVAVTPYHRSAVPSGPDVGTLVVGRPGA
jgi:nucleotide-binding universal stress UspA family protein